MKIPYPRPCRFDATQGETCGLFAGPIQLSQHYTAAHADLYARDDKKLANDRYRKRVQRERDARERAQAAKALAIVNGHQAVPAPEPVAERVRPEIVADDISAAVLSQVVDHKLTPKQWLAVLHWNRSTGELIRTLRP